LSSSSSSLPTTPHRRTAFLSSEAMQKRSCWQTTARQRNINTAPISRTSNCARIRRRSIRYTDRRVRCLCLRLEIRAFDVIIKYCRLPRRVFGVYGLSWGEIADVSARARACVCVYVCVCVWVSEWLYRATTVYCNNTNGLKIFWLDECCRVRQTETHTHSSRSKYIARAEFIIIRILVDSASRRPKSWRVVLGRIVMSRISKYSTRFDSSLRGLLSAYETLV